MCPKCKGMMEFEDEHPDRSTGNPGYAGWDCECGFGISLGDILVPCNRCSKLVSINDGCSCGTSPYPTPSPHTDSPQTIQTSKRRHRNEM